MRQYTVASRATETETYWPMHACTSKGAWESQNHVAAGTSPCLRQDLLQASCFPVPYTVA